MHALADAKGRPIGFFMPAGQVSDHTGAAVLLGSLPKAGWLLADRGYDADWFRDVLKDKGIKACIPDRKSLKQAVKYDKRRCKRRNRIEIMFGRFKDWPIVGKAVPPDCFLILLIRCNPIRPMPGNALLCHHARRNRLVVAVKSNETRP